MGSEGQRLAHAARMRCHCQSYFDYSTQHYQAHPALLANKAQALSRLRRGALVARRSACHAVGHQPRVSGIVWQARELEAIQVFLRIVAPIILVDPALQPAIWAHAAATTIQPVMACATRFLSAEEFCGRERRRTYPSAFVQVQGPFQFLLLHS